MLDHVRSAVQAMAPYVPGEQPRNGGFIKLNTNENPYPPSPRVFEALREALTGDRLRKYPDPMGTAFRRAAGRVLNVDPDSILIGNGSDDLLTILTRAFVPEGGLVASPTPSYLLYRTLAEIQGARFDMVPYTTAWDVPDPWPLPQANLTFLANPNSPSGTMLSGDRIRSFQRQLRGPLVVDEAYADFADGNMLELARERQVIVTRSFSKFYSLAGIRFGFGVADPALVWNLVKIKDSYNCDALSLIAATAALEDQEYVQANRARVLATRSRLERELAGLGFIVTPSQSNFVWVRRNDQPVKPIYEMLKQRQILVRYMNYQGYGDGLRISVGTKDEIDELFVGLKIIL